MESIGYSSGNVFETHRIHGAAIYGVPWIPSIYPVYVSINLPAPWIRHGNGLKEWIHVTIYIA